MFQFRSLVPTYRIQNNPYPLISLRFLSPTCIAEWLVLLSWRLKGYFGDLTQLFIELTTLQKVRQ